MKTATVLTLQFSLICLARNVDNAFVETKFTKFAKYLDFEGLPCPADEILFSDSERRNLPQCVGKCSDIPWCIGVVRFHGNNKCVGCKSQFLYENSALTLNKTSYFRRQTYIVVEDKKNWEEAKKNSENLGGHLAHIKSKEEEKFIHGYIIQSFTHDKFWLGGTDTEEEGTFLWTDGTKLSDFYTNWDSNQPNNADSQSMPENCLLSRNITGDRKWGDSECSMKRFSLCELQ